MRLVPGVCCAALLALASGCSEERPGTAGLASDAMPDAAAAQDAPAVCEDRDPAPPVEMVVAAAAPAPPQPKAASRPRVETTEPPTAIHLPLDVLLRTPQGAGRPGIPLDLRDLDDTPVAAGPPPPGVFEAWKDRVRIERHTEATGHAGPKQGSVSQTDAGLRIPVDESVSLEGGVRVDQRDDPQAEAPVRKSIPRVGVEVRF